MDDPRRPAAVPRLRRPHSPATRDRGALVGVVGRLPARRAPLRRPRLPPRREQLQHRRGGQLGHAHLRLRRHLPAPRLRPNAGLRQVVEVRFRRSLL